jgi:hypothetical protein
MSLKKGKVKVDGKLVDKFVIENNQDIINFFKKKPDNNILGMRKAFERVVGLGETILVSAKPHPMTGVHTWCTTGKDNYILVSVGV